MKQSILPKRIVLEHCVTNSSNLLVKKSEQIHLNEKEVTTLTKGSFIVLDFGKEIPGSIRILTSNVSTKYTTLHIRFGESVGECMAPLGYKNSTNDHSPRDIYYPISFLSDIVIGNTGFRFVRIDLEESAIVSFKNIYAVMDDIKPIDGYFKSDDKLLNNIFDIASYTNAVCIRNNMYYDGIKRDRLVWIGDSYPIYKTAKYLYLNNEELINSLSFIREECAPPEWVNFSPMYSFWWMLLLCEYHLDNNDFASIEHLFDFFKETLHRTFMFIGDKGEIEFPFLFIDWPSHYDENDELGNDLIKKEDEVTGCRFLCLITYKKILSTFKDYLSEEEINLINKTINNLNKGNTDVIKFKQIAALGVEAGIIDDNKKLILLNNGAHGLSTFQSYFIFKAIASLNEDKVAFDQLKEYYGAMIELGATTFFEDFDLDWSKNATKLDEVPTPGKKDFHGDNGAFCYKGYRNSLCHGWSSGVVAYIFEFIIGVKQIAPNKYIIKPNTIDLKNIKCGFATKYGLVELEISDNKIVSLTKPNEVEIEY